MGRFFPLYIRRSDGKIEIKSRHKLAERNEPTKEQLDKTPDAKGISDFYREVDINEQKHLDWRRKLGGMLARDLQQSDADVGYILATFPEHYRLYEHVKRALDDTKAKTTKNHAGGGNERQDAYLYGHPLGRKKRYRSPADFYPHLLWLATDPEGDPDNCACKICCPEELDEKTQPVKKETAQDTAKANTSQKRTSSVSSSTAQQQAPPTKPDAARATASATPQPTVSQARPPQAALPAPQQAQPLIIKEDQRLDLLPDSFVFRQGELVWFQKGPAWGLGVIARRWSQNGAAVYTVQPLSHPFSQISAVNVRTDDLRPWLAWSVPDFTHQGLNTIPVTFDTADWSTINSGVYGKGDLEVDGSILAAKAIDCSYTPCQLLSRTTNKNAITETYYNCLFLGAERIWRGDIVRLRTNGGLNVLVISAIVEQSTTPHTGVPHIQLRGDMYSFQQHPTPAADLSSLPTRMRNDLTRRNATSLPKQGYATSYALQSANTAVDLTEVKGRWYEATLLAPVISSRAQAAADLAAGQMGDMGPRMNSRLDCQKGGPTEQHRREDRRTAIGDAAPAGFKIVDSNGEQV